MQNKQNLQGGKHHHHHHGSGKSKHGLKPPVQNLRPGETDSSWSSPSSGSYCGKRLCWYNSLVKWAKPNPWQRKTAQVSYVLPSPILARIANAQELDIDGCTVHLHSIICQESLQLSWHRKGVPSVRFPNLFRKLRRLRNLTRNCPQEDVLYIIRSISYIMWDK